MVDALGAPPSGQAPLPKAPQLPAATIELAKMPPQALLASEAQTFLAATAAGRESPEVLLLDTLKGQLALKTNLILPAGAKVELQLQGGSPGSVTILSVNGAPFRGVTPQVTAPTPSTVLNLATSVEATVLAPSQAARGRLSASASDMTSLLPPGTQLLLRIMGFKTPNADVGDPPTSPPEDTTATPTEEASAPAQGALPAKGPQPASSPASPPNLATAAGPSVSAEEPAQASSTSIQRFDPNARTFSGTILPPAPGAVPDETIIQTPVGLLAIATKLAAQPGTEVHFERVSESRPAPAETAAKQPLVLAGSWPALDQALTALQTAAPQLAAQFRADFALGGERLGPALLFFVGILKGKAPWPASAIDQALDIAGQKSLHERVAKDVEELRAIASNPATGDWQTYVLPLLAGAFVRPARLYVKRRKQDRDEASSEGEPNRFILEVELSRLGALQFDGLVRGMQFDLVLRSQRMLAIELRREISVLFNNTLGSVGYKGGISYTVEHRFQTAPLDVFRPHLGVSA